ncbi:MAG: glycosyltransferase family 4 protein [Bdellovibrionales bacterium]|nr:glycosyltransferase family 4 protein [Bdellovibrionales bacterium]
MGLVVRWIYRNSNLVFIQSKQFEESVKRWGGVDTEIQYLPNWAPQLFETHLKSKNANSESKIKLLFAGNLGRAQGVSYLLDAMNILKNENVVLDIYGDGSEKPLLMDKIKKLDLFDKVKLKEVLPLEQMPGLYEKYDALVVSLIDDKNLERVLPSKVQGYLASGKPILAMGSGELKRVIVESESGYVCDPEDAKSFSEIVLKFLKMSRGDRSILGSHGKNYYFNNFSRNNQINQIIQQFKKAG